MCTCGLPGQIYSDHISCGVYLKKVAKQDEISIQINMILIAMLDAPNIQLQYEGDSESDCVINV